MTTMIKQFEKAIAESYGTHKGAKACEKIYKERLKKILIALESDPRRQLVMDISNDKEEETYHIPVEIIYRTAKQEGIKL